MSDTGTQSVSFPELAEKVARLYMTFGKPGQGVFSEEAEAAISVEINRLGDFSVRHLTSEDVVSAALDPTVEAEGKALALTAYDAIVRYLPSGIDPGAV
jgi:hypothetical protein